MRTIQTTVIIIMVICAGNILANRQNEEGSSFKSTVKIGKSVALAVWSNPVANIVFSCSTELYCYYEYFDDPKHYIKCTFYVLKCIFKEIVGITKCLYDVGGDVLIEWYQHGTYIENYDYIKIALDVFKCTGIDQRTLNYIRKNIWG